MASKPGTKQSADQEFDPKYEWQENAANYVLRLHLSGFRKEDFRVQVDGAGRLTVRGQRADGASKHVRFHKVFQLPPTSNLDGISGRFDAGVLTLTVPKRPAPPPATIDEIVKPAKEETKPKEEAKPKETAKPKEEAKPTEEEAKKAEPKMTPQVQAEKPGKEEAKKTEQLKEEINKPPKAAPKVEHKEETSKPKEEAKKKAAEAQQIKDDAEAKRSKPEQRTAPPAVKKEKDDKPTKAEAAAAPAETKPPQEAKDVDRESLLERVRRRAEEERAKAAAAAEEAVERQRKQSACGGWKERVTGELQGLANSEWAEGVVDTVKKNKEVIATAVAAFSLGLFASRLFSRN
ncbi:hypothetical protein EJB05_52597 [Eragrostis curvula]|uniref:SHSP domain-containing protein n=1 Tax=Eragrostis curvula TaxID=38414 RepID=A0A5J9SSM1_9POAL|nr:hypothetical protein EJB05_52597 [Eragrostis curvula]